MYDILIALDQDVSRARAQAAAVSDMPLDTETTNVMLHHVFVDNPEGASASRVRSVRRAQSDLEEKGFEPTVTEASGDPATEILEAAEEFDVDLIVIAGRKRSPAGKALFGSVTQDVVLGTDRSILVCSTSE